MMHVLQNCWRWMRPRGFSPHPPLILINGLAEQAASWFRNRTYWSRWFDVKVPEFLVYEGPVLQRRIQEGLPISVAFLTDQLALFLDQFVQAAPYHLVASSLGCQIALELAARYPDRVGRLVLLCPSGMGGEEKLPIVEGVRANDTESMLSSIFHNPRRLPHELIDHYGRMMRNKAWKKGILRTVRGTCTHQVVHRLPQVAAPALVICGEHDQIVDTPAILAAIQDRPNFQALVIPRCGHAPQIECAPLVNKRVADFLRQMLPDAAPRWLSRIGSDRMNHDGKPAAKATEASLA